MADLDMMQRLFGDWKPHDFYSKGSASPLPDEYRIIDDVKETMNHDFLNFNVAGACDIIKVACDNAPGARSKALLAGLRGQGGGKTRTLEEIRLSLGLKTEVLVIAITFNYLWTSVPEEFQDFDLSPKITHGNACYVSGVIARMASVFFCVPFADVLKQLTLRKFVERAIAEPICVLQAFIEYMTNRVGRPITHVVVLLDESAKGDKFIASKFDFEDVTNLIRRALLDPPPHPMPGFSQLHICLVMTSLSLGPIGKTESSRDIEALDFPIELDEDLILTTWWSKKKSRLDESVLKIASAMFSTVPRLVEFAGRELENAHSISELLELVLKRIKRRYSLLKLPTQDMLFALAFCHPVQLTPPVMLMVKNSIFINALQDFEQTSEIIPQSNLVMLIAASYGANEASIFIDLFRNLLSFVDPPLENAGAALEQLLYRWINIRARLINIVKKNMTFSLRFFLQLQAANFDGEIETTLDYAVDASKFWGRSSGQECLENSSRANKLEFLKEVKNLLLPKAVYVYFSAKGEAFDIMMTFGEKLVFIDTKSQVEDEKSDQKQKRSFKGSSQAKHMQLIMEGSGIDYIYVYLSTHGVATSARGNVFRVGRDVSRALLGPLWQPYRAIRTELGSKRGL